MERVYGGRGVSPCSTLNRSLWSRLVMGAFRIDTIARRMNTSNEPRTEGAVSSREYMPDQPQVMIEENGRGGTIWYREGSFEVRFDWEFGGSCLALIWSQELCAARSSGSVTPARAQQILEFVAAQAIEQKAPNSKFKIDAETCDITIG